MSVGGVPEQIREKAGESSTRYLNNLNCCTGSNSASHHRPMVNEPSESDIEIPVQEASPNPELTPLGLHRMNCD